jgi:hypothetical protein
MCCENGNAPGLDYVKDMGVNARSNWFGLEFPAHVAWLSALPMFLKTRDSGPPFVT